MNLVISGTLDHRLREAIHGAIRPAKLRHLHDRADRYEGFVDSSSLRSQVAQLCNVAGVDHAFVEEGRSLSSFRLLVMDMDSTLITIECIDEMADFAGRKAEVAAITESAMRGDIKSFAESLRQRVALLAGVDVDVLRRVYDERLTLTPGATELLMAASTCGVYRMLVSGGFTYFTDRLKSRLALEAAYGNSLEVSGGRLTGRVIDPIIGPSEKATFVTNTLASLAVDRDAAIVIGDGANDIAMMKAASCSVSYRGKPLVEEAATHTIKFGNLEVLTDWYPPTSMSATDD